MRAAAARTCRAVALRSSCGRRWFGKAKKFDNLKPFEVSFGSLGLRSSLVSALQEKGISSPTPIQQKAIPAILRGRNVMLGAQTGTGKTLAFLLPLVDLLKREELPCAPGEDTIPLKALREDMNGFRMQRLPNRPRALVLVPTRELAVQITGVAKGLAHHAKIRVVPLLGGQREKQQKVALESPVDIVVSTPGRAALLQRLGLLFWGQTRYVVMDEIDTLHEGNFLEETDAVLHPLLERMRSSHQRTSQFIGAGASLPGAAREAIAMRYPKFAPLQVGNFHHVVPQLEHAFVTVGLRDKLSVLADVLSADLTRAEGGQWHVSPTLVFCNTIQSCRAVEHFLAENGFRTGSCHGEIPSRVRTFEFGSFRDGSIDVLVATDIAARGVDLPHVEHVVLFDFVRNPVDFLHRAGRAGRAGRPGKVTSLLAGHDKKIARFVKASIEKKHVLVQNTELRT